MVVEVDDYLNRAQGQRDSIMADLFSGLTAGPYRDAIFMAGSPGAGKSEVAAGLFEGYDNHALIDADAFRTYFEDYNGQNASLFQKPAAWLVDQSFKEAVANGYSFILDATFAVLSAEKNVIRALKNGYRVTLFYVYQDPLVAWTFTRKRQDIEGRHVPKKTFIESYCKARENVIKVKKRHPEVMVHLAIKNYQNDILEVHYDTDNIELLVPENYSMKELEVILDD